MLKRKSKNYPQNRINYKSSEKDCNLCPLRDKCISGGSFRTVSHYDSPCYDKARGWYDSGYGRIMQKLRGTILEGIMGQAKTYHGMARARFRGLKKVEIQFLLTATALNLKKMVKMLDVEEVQSRLSRKFTDICQITKDIFKNFVIKLAIEVPLATSPLGFIPVNPFSMPVVSPISSYQSLGQLHCVMRRRLVSISLNISGKVLRYCTK